MAITRKILIKLFDKLKGDYLYDLSAIPGPDGCQATARCIGYRTEHIGPYNLALLMQRSDYNGWALKRNPAELRTSYFDPSIIIDLNAPSMRQINVDEIVLKELLRQKKSQL